VPQRILVVDDQPEICDLLTIWLDDDPRCERVVQAHDLDVAVQLADREHPDVIVLDFHVGARTSVEALPELRRSCPHARILMHTGSRDEAVRAKVEGRGVDGILEKATVSIPDVVEIVLG
jgi:DNA-binding NarL/FixJ family response regulator